MKPETLSYRQPPRAAVLAATFALLLLGACAPHTRPKVATDVDVNVDVPACNASLCNISNDTWENHIEPRHCTGTCQPKSIFEDEYCEGRATAVQFCRELMNRPDCQGEEQANGNIAYTATFEDHVGVDRDDNCALTLWGTVIYNPRRNQRKVVTQFPGLP